MVFYSFCSNYECRFLTPTPIITQWKMLLENSLSFQVRCSPELFMSNKSTNLFKTKSEKSPPDCYYYIFSSLLPLTSPGKSTCSFHFPTHSHDTPQPIMASQCVPSIFLATMISSKKTSDPKLSSLTMEENWSTS